LKENGGLETKQGTWRKLTFGGGERRNGQREKKVGGGKRKKKGRKKKKTTKERTINWVGAVDEERKKTPRNC